MTLLDTLKKEAREEALKLFFYSRLDPIELDTLAFFLETLTAHVHAATLEMMEAATLEMVEKEIAYKLPEYAFVLDEEQRRKLGFQIGVFYFKGDLLSRLQTLREEAKGALPDNDMGV